MSARTFTACFKCVKREFQFLSIWIFSQHQHQWSKILKLEHKNQALGGFFSKKEKKLKKASNLKKKLKSKSIELFAKVREKISKIQRGVFYRIWLKKPRFPDQDSESVMESESSSRYVQSRKRTRNRVLDLDSLITGTETGLQDWTLEGIGTAEPGIWLLVKNFLTFSAKLKLLSILKRIYNYTWSRLCQTG